MIVLAVLAIPTAACIAYVVGWLRGHAVGVNEHRQMRAIQAQTQLTQRRHIELLEQRIDAAYTRGHIDGANAQRAVDSSSEPQLIAPAPARCPSSGRAGRGHHNQGEPTMRATVYSTDLAQPPGVRIEKNNEVGVVIDGTTVWIDAGNQLDKLTRLHAWAASLAEQTASALADNHPPEQNHYDLDADDGKPIHAWHKCYDDALRLADRVEKMQQPTVLEPVDGDGCDAVTAQLVEELRECSGWEDGRQYADAIKTRVATLLANR